jgi:choline monooxygenase
MANGPSATKGFSEQYFGPGVSEDFVQELIEFNRQVGEEDDALTDSVQRGLRAGIPEKGRFLAGAEHLVGHFQRLVASALVGDAGEVREAAERGAGVARRISVQPTD